MANMSTAYGTVCAYAETKENAERVLNVIHRELGDVDYGTCIDECRDGTLAAEYTGENWMAESSFTGTGRWVFEENVHRLSDWLQESMNELKPLDFRLEFEFDDYEPGCSALYRATMTADHKAGDSKIEFEMSDYESYDITAKNLRSLNFGDDVMDLNDPKDRLMEWFISRQGEEYADDIKAVFKDEKAWKEFKSDYSGCVFYPEWPDAEDIGWKERAGR
jgi:hypothetical protein